MRQKYYFGIRMAELHATGNAKGKLAMILEFNIGIYSLMHAMDS
jgi:hypothetical protein